MRRGTWIKIGLCLVVAALAVWRRGERGSPELPSRILSRKIEPIKFREALLRDVLERLQASSGVAIVADWNALAAIGVPRNQRSFGEDYELGKTLGEALSRAMFDRRPYGSEVMFRVEPNRVVITSGREIISSMQCRMYDVQDLLDDLTQSTKLLTPNELDFGWSSTWRFSWQPPADSIGSIGGPLVIVDHPLPDYVQRRDVLVHFLESVLERRGPSGYAGAFNLHYPLTCRGGKLVVRGPVNEQQEVAEELQRLRGHMLHKEETE